MTPKKVWILIIAIFLALLASACSEKKEKVEIKGVPGKRQTQEMPEIKPPTYDNSLPGEDGMKNAVRGYGQAIIDAHLSTRHIEFIRRYATSKETQRTYVFIKTDWEAGRAMAMRLNKLVFDNVSTSVNANFVDTSEHWDFQYLDIKTSKPLEPVKEMRYKLRYILIKEDNEWVVSKLEEREDTKIGEYYPPRWKLQ